MKQSTVLLVDDEPNLTAAMKRALRDQPWKVICAGGASEALEILDREPVDVVVSDERMPGISGCELLARVRTRHPDTIRMVLSGQASLDSAIKAINEGEVYRYFLKPCNPAELATTIRQALAHKQLLALSKQLLRDYQRKNRLLQELEEVNPGLTQLNLDDDGAILVEEDDDGDINDFLASLEREIAGARSPRT